MRRGNLALTLGAALLFVFPAFAQEGQKESPLAPYPDDRLISKDSEIVNDPLLEYPDDKIHYRDALEQGITQALPEVEGAISWDLLIEATLEYDPRFDEMKPAFTPEIEALDGTEVKLVGFNVPLDSSGRRLLLSLISPSCPFCLPGGPETFVEVEAAEPIPLEIEPIVLEGTFRLPDEGFWNGYFYRMTDARLSGPAS